MLHAVSVPPTGGDTLFCDMAAVYDGLSDDTKARIDDLVAVHDFSRAFGHHLDDTAKAELREQYPVVEHPVVRTRTRSSPAMPSTRSSAMTNRLSRAICLWSLSPITALALPASATHLADICEGSICRKLAGS